MNGDQVAPDQRGYNQSSKPHDVESYHTDFLANDVKALIEYYNFSNAIVSETLPLLTL